MAGHLSSKNALTAGLLLFDFVQGEPDVSSKLLVLWSRYSIKQECPIDIAAGGKFFPRQRTNYYDAGVRRGIGVQCDFNLGAFSVRWSGERPANASNPILFVVQAFSRLSCFRIYIHFNLND